MTHATADHCAVRLGALSFSVPRLTLGAIRKLMRLQAEFAKIERPDSDAMFDHGLAVAALVFERAEPKLPDLEQIECSPQELRAAQNVVLEFSGLAPKTEAAGAPAPGK
jgi:hypothetical protein